MLNLLPSSPPAYAGGSPDAPAGEPARRRRLLRRGFLWMSLAALVAGFAIGGADGAAAAEKPKVVDFAKAGCDYGCLATRPARWLPDREPRMGLGIGFYQLRWSGWGKARATASGVVRSCAGSDCRRGKVKIAVYKRARTSNGLVYTCMRLKHIPVEPFLKGVAFDVDGDWEHNARC